MKYLFMGLIRLYQWTISVWLGPVCRFYPSCSHYGYDAFRVHGTLRGGWLTARRVVRCNPWNSGGVDFVPERRPRRGLSGGTRGAEPPEDAGRFRSSDSGSSSTTAGSAAARTQSPQGATR
ncbi:membrane protein insertion efficiency factor YidD [Sporichthya sp.]|uniref:membrane protein insertion efficiency factor YidD n=1 Tax=Sporichthya sp. TaxID=65475 RepID=UPI00178EEBAA|nr:membrane protein insertion efficiency factor YidD [Sporichthya sp.]MBA3741688.1 membrane protein insertion efficiency factor YidD [Sporichthya sp.]